MPNCKTIAICNQKLRTMNEEDLEKVSTFIGWIENKE